MTKFSWWTWLLGLAFLVFAFDAFIHGGWKSGVWNELVLAAFSIAFAFDFYRDVRRRGYRLPEIAV